MGAQRGQGLQAAVPDFGSDVLHHGRLGQAGYMRQIAPLPEPHEGLVDSPALMVELAKDAGRKAPGVEQIGHQHARLADLFNQTRVQESARAREAALASLFEPHADRNAPVLES